MPTLRSGTRTDRNMSTPTNIDSNVDNGSDQSDSTERIRQLEEQVQNLLFEMSALRAGNAGTIPSSINEITPDTTRPPSAQSQQAIPTVRQQTQGGRVIANAPFDPATQATPTLAQQQQNQGQGFGFYLGNLESGYSQPSRIPPPLSLGTPSLQPQTNPYMGDNMSMYGTPLQSPALPMQPLGGISNAAQQMPGISNPMQQSTHGGQPDMTAPSNNVPQTPYQQSHQPFQNVYPPYQQHAQLDPRMQHHWQIDPLLQQGAWTPQQTQTLTYVAQMKPPTWDGDYSKQTCREYLRLFDSACDHNRWPPIVRLSQIQSCLTLSALSWYLRQKQNNVQYSSWEHFKADMISHFSFRAGRSALESGFECRPIPGETWSKYHIRFEEAAIDIPIVGPNRELHLVAIYTKNLGRRIKKKIAGHHPQTLRELTTLLEDKFGSKVPSAKEINAVAGEGSEDEATPIAAVDNRPKCTHCKRLGHTVTRCWSKYPHLRKPRQSHDSGKKSEPKQPSIDPEDAQDEAAVAAFQKQVSMMQKKLAAMKTTQSLN